MSYRHDFYNKDNFPYFVCPSPAGNWDIYCNESGHCASIPTDIAAARGCRASHFGNLQYVASATGVKRTVSDIVPNK